MIHIKKLKNKNHLRFNQFQLKLIKIKLRKNTDQLFQKNIK